MWAGEPELASCPRGGSVGTTGGRAGGRRGEVSGPSPVSSALAVAQSLRTQGGKAPGVMWKAGPRRGNGRARVLGIWPTVASQG